ncbi:MAG: hypothetical protein LBB08_02980 [Rickettsiales bacterium]|jgi:tRNA dimethylallyltransferase|nr:hypothetical protein [Rickettsiales bacterium]
MKKKSYIITGLSASGKSDLAYKLAKRIGGTIINADSVQIYRGIEVISANPYAGLNFELKDNGCEIDGVQHKLYSILDLADQISAGEYVTLARKEYEKAEVPIFVGGSGFYMKALIDGLSPIPDISTENRKRARDMVVQAPEAAIQLAGPEYDTLPRRARAIEVLLETGKPLSEWHKIPRTKAIEPTPARVLVIPTKEEYAAKRLIRKRIDEMMKLGALNEVRPHMPFGNRAIGIEELGRHIAGQITLAQALDTWEHNTVQYLKRQRTWFRHQMEPDLTIDHIPADADIDRILAL